MDPARRRRYLEAMGLELHVRRDVPQRASAAPDLLASLDAAVATPAVTQAPAPAMGVARVSGINGEITGLDWDALAAVVKDCQQCRLRVGCTQTVFGVGVRTAELLVVGEGPGADEDAKGEPFVGRAGQLLDAMLYAINRSRRPEGRQQGVYIANVVKCRPPNNRDPQPDEAAACRPYLERQIALVKPRLILAVGRIAAQGLLQTDQPIGKLRGPLHHYGPERIPVLVTYHPAYLLRSPREKARAWDDLKKVRTMLTEAA